jgi:hypothetical protein
LLKPLVFLLLFPDRVPDDFIVQTSRSDIAISPDDRDAFTVSA